MELAVEAAEEADPALAKACLRALLRQAEGRLLFAGEALVKAELAEFGDAKVGGVRVVEALRDGAKNGREHAVLSALSVAGLHPDTARQERFLQNALWLELNTGYRLFRFLEPLHEEAESVFEALATVALEPAEGSPAYEAHVSLRRALLNRFSNTSVALASGEEVSLTGRMIRPRAEGWRALVRLVTGYALLTWLVSGIGWLVRYRQEGTLSLGERGVDIRSAHSLFGNVIRERFATVPYGSVGEVGLTSRSSGLPPLVGGLCFGLAVVLGATSIFEGAWSGETYLLMLGALVILLGGGLDLAISRFWRGRGGREEFALDGAPSTRVRLIDVQRGEAESFAQAILETDARA